MAWSFGAWKAGRNPNDWRIAMDQVTAQVADLLRQQPGNVGLLSIDRGEGQTFSITLWESQEAAIKWLDNAAFRTLREEQLVPHIAEWTTTEGPVVRADLQRAAAVTAR